MHTRWLALPQSQPLDKLAAVLFTSSQPFKKLVSICISVHEGDTNLVLASGCTSTGTTWQCPSPCMILSIETVSFILCHSMTWRLCQHLSACAPDQRAACRWPAAAGQHQGPSCRICMHDIVSAPCMTFSQPPFLRAAHRTPDHHIVQACSLKAAGIMTCNVLLRKEGYTHAPWKHAHPAADASGEGWACLPLEYWK